MLGLNEIVLSACSSLGIGACFNGVTFRCNVDFRNAKMEGASFMNAFFVKESTFEEAQFNGSTIFISAKFGNNVSFKNAKFHGDATFSGTSVDITSTLHPNAPFYEKLSMDSAQFYEEVTFKRLNFILKRTSQNASLEKASTLAGQYLRTG